jgi:hypothetical protein
MGEAPWCSNGAPSTRHTPRDNTPRVATPSATSAPDAVAYAVTPLGPRASRPRVHAAGCQASSADETPALPGAVSQRYAQLTHVGHFLEATLLAIDARRHVLRGNAAGFRHTPLPPRCNAARFRRTSITTSVQRSARLAHVHHDLGATKRSSGARASRPRCNAALVWRTCITTSVQRSARLAHVRHDLGATSRSFGARASRPQRNVALVWCTASRPRCNVASRCRTCLTTSTQRSKPPTNVRHDRDAMPQAGDRPASRPRGQCDTPDVLAWDRPP